VRGAERAWQGARRRAGGKPTRGPGGLYRIDRRKTGQRWTVASKMWANPLRCAASCGAPLQRPTPRWPRTGRPKRGRPDYRHSARGHEGGMVARKRPAVFWTPGQVGRSITRPVREVNQRRPLGASSYSKVDKARRRLQPRRPYSGCIKPHNPAVGDIEASLQDTTSV